MVVQGAMFVRSSKPDLFSRSWSFQSICRWTEHMKCECQPFGLICRAGLCSSFTFWPQWSSTLTTCIHLFYYLSNVQFLFVGIGLENVKMDTSVERSVIPRRVWGFAAWYNKHADIYQRLTLERWHWSALSCCLLIDPPSTDVFTQSAKQLINTGSNVSSS